MLESQYAPRNVTIYCSHMQEKESSWDIFGIQTAENVIYTLTERFDFNLGFTKYFITSSALETLVQSNLCLLLRLSWILDISSVSFSSSLNILNVLSPYQKFVQICNAQNLGWGFIYQSCVVEINIAPQHRWWQFLLWKWVCI